MRHKAPLSTIELMIMVLIFALASAACLRAFTWADAQSRHNEARDFAVLYAENAAETVKHTQGDLASACSLFGGDWDGAVWTVRYDEQWQQTATAHRYTLSVLPERSGQPYLGQAMVQVLQADGTTLANLTICWQEVSSYD